VLLAMETLGRITAHIDKNGVASSGMLIDVVCDVVHLVVNDDPRVRSLVMLSHLFPVRRSPKII
jgi:hypothetical protein